MQFNTKFDFNDILLVPTVTTSINTRSDVSIKYANDKLPLFVSPMDTVIDSVNCYDYFKHGLPICLPRGIHIRNIFTKSMIRSSNFGMVFESYGVDDFKYMCDVCDHPESSDYILLDVANGHMPLIIEYATKFKLVYPNKKLMVGNIANPETYVELSNIGVDYIRVGIGGGSACLTSVHTGCGYPMASLISETASLKGQTKTPAHIVADGGFREYSDIIKALNLGADYVMIGSAFNKCIESAGDNYIFKKIKVSKETASILYRNGFTVYKKFRGMSTKEVQKKWGSTILKTSEGITTYRKVEYTLYGWLTNFTDYLKSSMSYCDCKTLDEFVNKSNYVMITDNAFKRFNK